MLAYYFDLALRSLKSSRGLSLLMVLALALGIGACMTTLTVYHVLSGDPIPGKSDRLFNVELDAGDMVGYQPGEEPTFQLTRYDAETLLRARKGKRQVMMTAAHVSLDDAEHGTVVGADEYVVKPFLRDVLIHNVERLIPGLTT